jgi:hypothetical protein
LPVTVSRNSAKLSETSESVWGSARAATLGDISTSVSGSPVPGTPSTPALPFQLSSTRSQSAAVHQSTKVPSTAPVRARAPTRTGTFSDSRYALPGARSWSKTHSTKNSKSVQLRYRPW